MYGISGTSIPANCTNLNITSFQKSDSFIHSFIRIHSFAFYSFIRSFIRSFIPSFIYSFICIHSFGFIHLFIYSFIHSFIHSFAFTQYLNTHNLIDHPAASRSHNCRPPSSLYSAVRLKTKPPRPTEGGTESKRERDWAMHTGRTNSLPCACIHSSWTCDTSTLETYYLNLIAWQLYA